MLVLIFFLGKGLRLLGLAAPLSPQGTATMGAVFLLGLFASFSSCVSLAGGFVLSLAATWRETHGEETAWKRLQPLLLFNAGRIAGFALLGALLGTLGGAVHLTSRMTGIFTLVVAAAMVALGLHLIHLLPRRACTTRSPSRFSARLRDLASSGSAPLALLLGALTFFLPCGFTQSAQLLALSSGSALSGGAIMLAFALGTLPSLLGISILSAVVEGGFAGWFLRFSGALVLVLGLLNIRSGLVLLGVDPSLGRVLPFLSSIDTALDPSRDPNVQIDAQGRQIISLTVTDHGYQPESFTIRAGFPTWVRAYAPVAVTGCATFLLAPSFGTSAPIAPGENWLGPLENPRKDFLLTCSMGMYKATVHVAS